MGENHQRRFCTFSSRGRVLHRYCGTSSKWRPPEPLSDHVPSFSGTHFGRNSVPAGEGGDRRSSRSPASLFVAGVCDTQALGLFENDSQHEANQSSFGQVPFSDGSSVNHPSFFESGRRRGLPGSSRRLLSYSYPSTFSGSSGVCLSGQVLPVQGSSLWAAPRSSDFHENRFDGHGASSKTGSSSFRLFGRLALGREVGGSAVGSFTDSGQHDSRSRVSHQLGEIRVRPDSHSVLSRSSTRYSSAACSSQSRQSRDDCRDCSISQTARVV